MTAGYTGPTVRNKHSKIPFLKDRARENPYPSTIYSSDFVSLTTPNFALHPSATKYTPNQLQQLLLPALLNLEIVEQSPRYHPEGDALYHSLQVYQLAFNDTEDPELLAAALFHDIGKAIDIPTHDKVGAQMLEGLMPARVVWLVEHHLDLLKHPSRTRKRLRGSTQLRDLEQLRRWDLAGRKTNIAVIDPEKAIDKVLSGIYCFIK